MARFINTLQVEDIPGDKWRLLQPLAYQSDVAEKTIVVPKGFETDFASVPRLPFMFWFLGDRGQGAAVIHDWLYFSGSLPRSVADNVFEEALKVQGEMGWLGRQAMWLGVRVGGWASYKKRHPSNN